MGVGLGIKITYAGAIYPFYFEFEAGFIGCASRIYLKDKGVVETDPAVDNSAPTSSSASLDSVIPVRRVQVEDDVRVDPACFLKALACSGVLY